MGGGARSHAWRQLLADATGALIKLPLEAESGCLGACIQALVALSHHAGRPVSFADATSRIVQMNTDSTLIPDPDRRAKYDAARLIYAAKLSETYPQIKPQS